MIDQRRRSFSGVQQSPSPLQMISAEGCGSQSQHSAVLPWPWGLIVVGVGLLGIFVVYRHWSHDEDEVLREVRDEDKEIKIKGHLTFELVIACAFLLVYAPVAFAAMQRAGYCATPRRKALTSFKSLWPISSGVCSITPGERRGQLVKPLGRIAFTMGTASNVMRREGFSETVRAHARGEIALLLADKMDDGTWSDMGHDGNAPGTQSSFLTGSIKRSSLLAREATGTFD